MQELLNNPYTLIIVLSVIIILSFLFNAVSERTSVPSVLMLILTGILMKQGMDALGVGQDANFFPILEVIGIVGLIMIVLEAALDLELTQEKLPMILKSLTIALIGLIGSAMICAWILQYFIGGISYLKALLYATPLSILSSAIIIPSVGNLTPFKKEFHIYESTLSDILGIMMFYFVEGLLTSDEASGSAVTSFFISFGLTILISLIASYILIFLFQNITAHVKLFLLISILLLLYAVGKKQHLSPLIIILVFGLIMSNHHLFFRGFLKNWLNIDTLKRINEDFHILTIETAFVVRTFFFVIFGITISLSELGDPTVWKISGAILASIYIIRYILFKLFVGKDITPQLYIAPRGLITVLLFFSIPSELAIEGFNQGILLFIIIATNIVMTISLIQDKQRRARVNQPLTDADLVIPAEKIYDGFKSNLLKDKYGDK